MASQEDLTCHNRLINHLDLQPCFAVVARLVSRIIEDRSEVP